SRQPRTGYQRIWEIWDRKLRTRRIRSYKIASDVDRDISVSFYDNRFLTLIDEGAEYSKALFYLRESDVDSITFYEVVSDPSPETLAGLGFPKSLFEVP